MAGNVVELKKQDDYLKSNISNLILAVRGSDRPRFTSFLDERQQVLAHGLLNHYRCENSLLFGGAEECGRKMLGVFPDGMESERGLFPIAVLRVDFWSKEPVVLTHRDYLGALMGLQIKREVIGDILTDEMGAFLFVSADIADFVRLNLDEVGRASVKVAQHKGEISIKPQEFDEITGTVSSLRLDCVCALLMKKSRSIASRTIESGLVRVNYLETENVSKQLSGGDVISIRGMGKFILTNEIRSTKKERNLITVQHYR